MEFLLPNTSIYNRKLKSMDNEKSYGVDELELEG